MILDSVLQEDLILSLDEAFELAEKFFECFKVKPEDFNLEHYYKQAVLSGAALSLGIRHDQAVRRIQDILGIKPSMLYGEATASLISATVSGRSPV